MNKFRPLITVSILLAGWLSVNPSLAEHVQSSGDGASGISSERGKSIFVDKGCVACHAVNGIGGHDAPPMDANTKTDKVNPFDFAARMWNHAPAMIAAQEDAWGEQVYFTGNELASIIAFAHDDKAQNSFSQSDLTEKAMKMMDHEHGAMKAPEAKGKKTGHAHAPGTPAH